jgi:hypothetical protein
VAGLAAPAAGGEPGQYRGGWAVEFDHLVGEVADEQQAGVVAQRAFHSGDLLAGLAFLAVLGLDRLAGAEWTGDGPAFAGSRGTSRGETRPGNTINDTASPERATTR